MVQQGSVTDEHELRSFAARSFRDGKPLLTLSELRSYLSGGWGNRVEATLTASNAWKSTTHSVYIPNSNPASQNDPNRWFPYIKDTSLVGWPVELTLQWSEPLVDPDQYQIFFTFHKDMICLDLSDFFHQIFLTFQIFSMRSWVSSQGWGNLLQDRPESRPVGQLRRLVQAEGSINHAARHILSIAMESQPTLVNDGWPDQPLGEIIHVGEPWQAPPWLRTRHQLPPPICLSGSQSFPKIFLLRWFWFFNVAAKL